MLLFLSSRNERNGLLFINSVFLYNAIYQSVILFWQSVYLNIFFKHF